MGRSLLKRRIAACLASLASLVVSSPIADAAEHFISIGGGPTAGIYYRVAQSICGLVNPSFALTKVRCSPESTPGSLYNIGAIQSGELDFAIVQSDLLVASPERLSITRGRAASAPLSVMSLHRESLTIVVTEGSAIRTVGDLVGRRLFAGGQGSGSRATWDSLERSLGWAAGATTKVAVALDASSNPLCSGQVDAIISLSGHPAAGVRDQLAACSSRLVAIDDSAIARFLSSQPNAHKMIIPMAAYGLSYDTTTLGVTAVLVARADLPSQVVHSVTSSVLRNFPQFRAVHPSLGELEVKGMRSSLPVALHPGAARAFEEVARSP